MDSLTTNLMRICVCHCEDNRGFLWQGEQGQGKDLLKYACGQCMHIHRYNTCAHIMLTCVYFLCSHLYGKVHRKGNDNSTS